jgi:hypothetical protein
VKTITPRIKFWKRLLSASFWQATFSNRGGVS